MSRRKHRHATYDQLYRVIVQELWETISPQLSDEDRLEAEAWLARIRNPLNQRAYLLGLAEEVGIELEPRLRG